MKQLLVAEEAASRSVILFPSTPPLPPSAVPSPQSSTDSYRAVAGGERSRGVFPLNLPIGLSQFETQQPVDGGAEQAQPSRCQKPRDVPGPTEPGPHSEPTTTPPFCLPLALPSRESFSRITPEVRFSLRACVIVRCDVHCILLCTVQVPTHISVLSRALFPGVAANPHACHTSSTFSHPTTSTRPVLTGVRVNVRLHQRLHHLFSFSSSALFFNPRWNHSLLTSTVQLCRSLSCSPSLSTTHARCVRLTLACQSLRTGPIDGLLLGDTSLQFPDFSSLHTFSKPKPITKPLSTSRLSSIRRPERGYTPPDRPRRSISKRILKRKLCRRSPLAHRLTGITLSD